MSSKQSQEFREDSPTPSKDERLASAAHQIASLNRQILEMEEGILGTLVKAKKKFRNRSQYVLAALSRFQQIKVEQGASAAIRKVLRRPENSALLDDSSTSEDIFGPVRGSIAPTTHWVESSSAPRMHVTWVVGGFLPKGGGHRNIFRMCRYLEKFGHRVSIYVTDVVMGDDSLRAAVQENFYDFTGKVERFRGSVDETDVLVATHWTTVQKCLDTKSSAKALAYFVQDYEPMFYPMGSEYLLAAQTYNNGFYHICSGEWIAALIKERHGGQVGHFKFPVDTNIYKNKKLRRKSRQIIFFAKPEMPRRCFHIGVQALSIAATKIPDLEVILYGSPSISEYAFSFQHQKLKFVGTLQELADLYNESALGICFSTTNPSLVPYEMMACGLPVLDLATEKAELNYGGGHDVAVLAGPDPSDVADAIVSVMSNAQALIERSAKGLDLVATFPDEVRAARIVEFHLQEALSAAKVAVQISAPHNGN